MIPLTMEDLPFIYVSTVDADKLMNTLVVPSLYPSVVALRDGEIGTDGQYRYCDYELANKYARQCSERYLKKTRPTNNLDLDLERL